MLKLDQIFRLACSSKQAIEELTFRCNPFYPVGFEQALVSRLSQFTVPYLRLDRSLSQVPGFWEALEDNHEITELYFDSSLRDDEKQKLAFHCTLNLGLRSLLKKEEDVPVSLWPCALEQVQTFSLAHRYCFHGNQGEENIRASCTYYLLRNGLDQILSS